MAIHTAKSLFYHIPKTGGIWVKAAMRAGGLQYDRVRPGGAHPYGLVREHSTPESVDRAFLDYSKFFKFAFVRHPVGWYESFWAYRMKTQLLDPKFPGDACFVHGLDTTFETFVLECLQTFPQGLVSQVYQFYVGPNGDWLDYVGHQENLVEDLVEALTFAGEWFDEVQLRKREPRNLAASLPKFRGRLSLSDEITARIREVEAWTIEKYYPNLAG